MKFDLSKLARPAGYAQGQVADAAARSKMPAWSKGRTAPVMVRRRYRQTTGKLPYGPGFLHDDSSKRQPPPQGIINKEAQTMSNPRLSKLAESFFEEFAACGQRDFDALQKEAWAFLPALGAGVTRVVAGQGLKSAARAVAGKLAKETVKNTAMRGAGALARGAGNAVSSAGRALASGSNAMGSQNTNGGPPTMQAKLAEDIMPVKKKIQGMMTNKLKQTALNVEKGLQTPQDLT